VKNQQFDRFPSFTAIDANGRNDMMGLEPKHFAFQTSCSVALPDVPLPRKIINLMGEGAG
jgi:hypothetical protein